MSEPPLTSLPDGPEAESKGSFFGATHQELRALLQFAPIGIALIKDRRFVRVNQAMCLLCGYAESELIGASTRLIYVDEAEYERVGRALYETRAGHEASTIEIRGRKKNGADIDAVLRLAYLDPSQPEAGAVCIAADITDRIRAEKRLREKDRQFATLMGNLPGMAYRCANDPKWTMELVSPGCLILTGFTAEEILGNRVLSYADLIWPEDQAPVWETVQAALAKHESFQLNYRIRTKDQTVKWVWEQGRGVFGKEGQLEALEGLIIDVTEQKRNEASLRSSEENYRSIFENAISGIFQIDMQGRYRRVSPALAQMHGFASPEEMIVHIVDITHQIYANPADRDRLRTLLFQSGRVENFEVEVLKKNGERFWILLNAVVVRDATGKNLYIEGSNIDITERKRVEDLRKAKAEAEAASRAKSAFLTHMSHEIRTPMNAMLGFCQLMLRDPSLTTKQRDYLATIDRNGEHLLGIITSILELAKIEASRLIFTPSRFSVKALLDDLDSTFRTRAEMKKLSFDVRVEPDAPAEICADRGKVRQILVNLIGNALKFTTRGRVSVRVRPPRAGEAEDLLYWEVEDTGAGISPDDLERLFEPFEQTETARSLGGTGLGLPISREYALRMNGSLSVQSTPGAGSVFCLALPKNELVDPAWPKKDEGPIRKLSLDRPAGEIRVLIADDVEDNRRLLGQFLLDVGFTVRAVGNGVDAVSEQARWQAHCILMDLKMPELDGLDAIRQIRKMPSSGAKIIALSAGTSDFDRQSALEAGADDFCSKPFRQDELLEKIKYWLLFSKKERPSAEPRSLGLAPSHAQAIAADLIPSLKKALIEADLDCILALLAELGQDNPTLASEFAACAERFDYEAILQRLDSPVV